MNADDTPTVGPVAVTAGAVQLAGDLTIPKGAQGIVVFAHGSGSSRKSPRNRFVAEVMQKAGLATLLFDLLTPEEEEAERYTAYLRFNIALLTGRLVQATDWLCKQDDLEHLAVGYFGASTGAAAALLAAVARPAIARAVVSRGGRPDLAMPKLSAVTAPTLFIVGGHDTEVLALNRVALDRLHCEKRLEIVPGATHLFEEPGTLEAAAGLARDWFVEHLANAHVGAARG